MSDALREGTYGRLITAAQSVEKISPRVRMAARLYATGAVPTKTAAAKAVGLNKEWFTVMSNHNPQVIRLVNEIDERIDDESVDMSTVLRTLGREAIKKITGLMNTASKEEIQLKAAVDLADRSTETSKIQKVQLEATQISKVDAKGLAEALVEAARVKQLYSGQVQKDFVRVDSDPLQGANDAQTGRLRGQSEEPLGTQASEQSAEAGEEQTLIEDQNHEAPRKQGAVKEVA